MNKIAIILISVVLLVVYGLLAMDYMKQGSEQERLLSEIEEVEQSQEALAKPSTDAYERLAAIQAELDAESEIIPSEIDSSDVVDIILSLAQQVGVKAIPLTTEPWVEQHIGGNIYRVFRLSVEIEGFFSKVTEYVTRLESGEYTTLIVENLVVEVDYEEEYTGGSTPVIASLDLAAFTQP
jgi:hypothetical protein